MKTTVEITFGTKMTICFDGYYYSPTRYRQLGEAIQIAEERLEPHDFCRADIIDANTGEVLATIYREE